MDVGRLLVLKFVILHRSLELLNCDCFQKILQLLEALSELILRAVTNLLERVAADGVAYPALVFLSNFVALLPVIAEHDVDEFEQPHFYLAETLILARLAFLKDVLFVVIHERGLVRVRELLDLFFVLLHIKAERVNYK
jgi:hypothetical protein